MDLDVELSDATQRGRPRRRKNLSCLGIFACGALPRSGSAEASPEQAQGITPTPAAEKSRDWVWSGRNLVPRRPNGGLVEQLKFKSQVLRCSSAGSLRTASRPL